LATNNKYDDAQKILSEIINEINDKLKNNINEELKLLIKDLEDVKKRCVPNEWNISGNKTMLSINKRYMHQTSNISPM